MSSTTRDILCVCVERFRSVYLLHGNGSREKKGKNRIYDEVTFRKNTKKSGDPRKRSTLHYISIVLLLLLCVQDCFRSDRYLKWVVFLRLISESYFFGFSRNHLLKSKYKLWYNCHFYVLASFLHGSVLVSTSAY